MFTIYRDFAKTFGYLAGKRPPYCSLQEFNKISGVLTSLQHVIELSIGIAALRWVVLSFTFFQLLLGKSIPVVIMFLERV